MNDMKAANYAGKHL